MISVALKFIPEKNDAPVVVASGAGFMGEKIQEIAKQNDVKIVKDEGLAEALYQVPVGEEIPENLYKAVAVIFSYIYKLEKHIKT